MIDKKTLNSVLGEHLGNAGYVRTGRCWRRVRSGVASVVELQKSQYDSQHFLNVGFYLRQLGEADAPMERQCHVRSRANAVFSDQSPSVNELLYPAYKGLKEGEHVSALVRFICDSLIPLCDELGSAGSLLAAIREGKLDSWLVTMQARGLAESS